jgi:hypothetical protein
MASHLQVLVLRQWVVEAEGFIHSNPSRVLAVAPLLAVAAPVLQALERLGLSRLLVALVVVVPLLASVAVPLPASEGLLAVNRGLLDVADTLGAAPRAVRHGVAGEAI